VNRTGCYKYRAAVEESSPRRKGNGSDSDPIQSQLPVRLGRGSVADRPLHGVQTDRKMAESGTGRINME
jgi:hypothetical protein